MPRPVPPGSLSQKRNRAEELSLKAALQFLWAYLAPYKKQLIWLCLSLLLASGAVLSLGVHFKTLINKGLSQQNIHALYHAVGMLVVTACIMALASYIRLRTISFLGETTLKTLKSNLFSHILQLPISFFEKTASGDLLSRLNTDTQLIQFMISQSLPIATRNIFIGMGGIIFMAWFSPFLTFLVLLIVPVIILSVRLFGKSLKAIAYKTQQHLGTTNALAEEAFYAIRTVKSYNREDYMHTLLSEALNKASTSAIKQSHQKARLTFTIIFLAFSAVSLVLFLGGQWMIEGTITGGDLSAFIFYAIAVAGSLNVLGEIMGDLHHCLGAAYRLKEIFSHPSPKDNTYPLSPPHFERTLSMANIFFRYPSLDDGYQLSNFSLCLPQGKSLALVGPSGSGKTTILQLLLGFYEAQKGSITIDGKNIQTLPPHTRRAYFAYVAQDPLIFSTTIYDNILFGDPAASKAAVEQAAKEAGCLSFIEALPQGFDTKVGEKGVKLSGGQRQRIALARALLCNAPILLFDEITSALDAENEKIIHDMVQNLRGKKTFMIITHRLSTIKNVDEILVLEGGHVVEQGNHATLLKQGGLYKRLCSLQEIH